MPDNPLLFTMLAVSLFCGLSLVFVLPLLKPTRVEQQIRKSIAAGPAADGSRWGERILTWFFRQMHSLRAGLGIPQGPDVRQRLMIAGLRGEWHVEMYLAIRMLSPVAGLVLGSLILVNPFMWALVLGIIGYMLPDMWLSGAIRRRRAQVRLSLPDALDLLVICVEAGLGVDQALQRVGSELAYSHPAISAELTQVNLEQRAGSPRLQAWRSMAARTKVEEVEAFVSMLAQTERFGTPIAKALSTFAQGLRTKRRQRAEELAAKTTVKMIFPLVFFIFPSMFIVLIGPAVISLARHMGSLLE